MTRRLSESVSPAILQASVHHTEESAGLHFPLGDPEDPRNFPSWRKWAIIIAIVPLDLSVSWGSSGYSPAASQFAQEFGVSSEVATLGLSVYVAGLALGPMFLAPLSERYGRTPLYTIPYGIYLLFLVGTALVDNLAGFLVLRCLSGLFAGVTIANFGGTIADLWPRDQFGPPMSFFLWAAVCGSPSGYFLFNFVAQTEGWRKLFWAMLGISGGLWLIVCVVLVPFHNETRHSVLLRRRAKRLHARGNSDLVKAQTKTRETTLIHLFSVTLSRSFKYLFSEPIVIFASLYNGYLYGLSFLFTTAYTLVWGADGYGFSDIGVGLAFLGMIVGISVGPIVNIWQERYYQRRIRTAPELLEDHREDHQDGIALGEPGRLANIPEARVQLGKVAAVLLPISLFWFAWTCPPQYHIHWMVPMLATVVFGYSFYTLILMSYLYIEDSYIVYAASALAAVGLVRNFAGAGFPLFGTQMFENEGYNWAGSILAFLACLLMPIPFVLERYGSRLRARSRYAQQSDKAEED